MEGYSQCRRQLPLWTHTVQMSVRTRIIKMSDAGDESKRKEVFKANCWRHLEWSCKEAQCGLCIIACLAIAEPIRPWETVSSLKEKLACDFFHIVVVSRLAVNMKDYYRVAALLGV
jgi:hypothetical protein